MSRRATARSRGATSRVLSLLLVFGLCSGAVAYAASRSADSRSGLDGNHKVEAPSSAPGSGGTKPAGTGEGKRGEKLLRTNFIEHPEAATAVAEPQFRFHVAPRSPDRPPSLSEPAAPAPGSPQPPRRFQCRLDGAEWSGCSSPHRLAGLDPGDHQFAVRAFTRDGRPGPVAAYSWRQLQRFVAVQAEVAVEPEPDQASSFAIESQPGALADLYPGHPAQPLPLVVSNPHSVAIEVTSLAVAVVSGNPGCAPENFALTPSSASPATPLPVPAEGSVSLPTPTISAPSIAMLDLPVNQNACQGAEVPLVFSGEAQG